MTFAEYKERISIIKLLEDIGYVYDKKDGRTSPVYKLYNSAGNKIDEVIIENPFDFANQHYFDRNYKGGDLISFIKNHRDKFVRFFDKNETIFLNNVLKFYANDFTNFSKKVNTKFSKLVCFDNSKYTILSSNAENFTYLINERKLSIETIKKFQPFIRRIQKKGDEQYINTAFPFRVPGTKEITNFEIRNTHFKGFADGGDKKNSVWYACFVPPEQVTNIYFFESAIDAMSYYQLFCNEKKLDNSAFVSLGGRLSENQVKNSISYFKNAKIHVCFDNDFAGNSYDILAYLIVSKAKYEIIESDKNIGLKINFNDKDIFIDNENISLETFLKKSGAEKNLVFSEKALLHKDFNDQLKDYLTAERK